MSMLCSLCSLHRLPIRSIALVVLYYLLINMICSLYTLYMVRMRFLYACCAQDGPSFAIQAWPSHSRRYCKTCIHGIRDGGAVPTHGCREPSDALVQSRTSIFLERLIGDIQQAGYDRIILGSIFTLQLSASRWPPTETNPTQSVAFALLEAFRDEGQSWPIISHHITYIDHHRSCHHMP